MATEAKAISIALAVGLSALALSAHAQNLSPYDVNALPSKPANARVVRQRCVAIRRPSTARGERSVPGCGGDPRRVLALDREPRQHGADGRCAAGRRRRDLEHRVPSGGQAGRWLAGNVRRRRRGARTSASASGEAPSRYDPRRRGRPLGGRASGVVDGSAAAPSELERAPSRGSAAGARRRGTGGPATCVASSPMVANRGRGSAVDRRAPDAVPERWAQASPSELLPLGFARC